MKEIKTIRGMASELCRREGRKSQARIGDVRELLSILSDIFNEHGPGIEMVLFLNGSTRARKRKIK